MTKFLAALSIVGLGVIVWLLAFGSTHDGRGDQRYCNPVLGTIGGIDDYDAFYAEVDAEDVRHEDDLRFDTQPALAAACDRYRQRELAWSLLIAIPATICASAALRRLADH